jgi:hypothetical protein
MNRDKSFEYVKQWRELERRQKELDFEQSQWARRLRGEFAKGEVGDEHFTGWCVTELDIAKSKIAELLLRATAAAIVSDPATWKRVGGYATIKHLDEFSRRDQVAVLEAVKATGKAIRTVVEERGLREPVKRHDARKDAAVLAVFVRGNCRDVPPYIKAIVARYDADLSEVRAA